MKILQVCPTYGQSCGIGNFSRNLETALRGVHVDVDTTTSLTPAHECDVTLIQHEWDLFRREELDRYCEESSVPVVLFAHSGGVERLAGKVDGVIAMHPGIVAWLERPSLVIPHPAWIPRRLEDRRRLRKRFGMNGRTLVVGSSGFITGFRQFPDVLSRLLPVLREEGGCVELMAARCGGPWSSGGQRIEPELNRLRREFPGHFRHDGRFLDHEELNLRLQACDLVWCFTTRASSAYASGVAADQYASGTMMVLADVEQHRDVITNPGVVAAPADLDGFVETLLATLRRKRFSRYRPRAYSWPDAANDIVGFLRERFRQIRSLDDARPAPFADLLSEFRSRE